MSETSLKPQNWSFSRITCASRLLPSLCLSVLCSKTLIQVIKPCGKRSYCFIGTRPLLRRCNAKRCTPKPKRVLNIKCVCYFSECRSEIWTTANLNYEHFVEVLNIWVSETEYENNDFKKRSEFLSQSWLDPHKLQNKCIKKSLKLTKMTVCESCGVIRHLRVSGRAMTLDIQGHVIHSCARG